MGAGIRLGRIAGVEVSLDWSLLIIFLLITTSLAMGVFPAWHPGWGAALAWIVALGAAVLFFASVLAHELSHAIVGRARGVHIPKIRLFVFGGMAQMENEPSGWRDELAMAIVGPITSLVLAVAFIWIAVGTAGGSFSPASPARLLASLGPAQTLLLWLGQVNFVLALFNLVPGFPLDGGRVLRAIMWAASGSLHRATRWASAVGQGFAWILIGLGVAMVLGVRVPVFGVGLVSGLWLMFIGWFLNNAAVGSYRQLLVREALEHVPVARLMQTRFETVPPDMRVSELVDEHLMRGDQRAFPVLTNGRLLGVVGLKDVRRLSREAWPATAVHEIMTPVENLHALHPEDDAYRALAVLAQRDVNQVPILQGDRVLGILRRQDVLNWLALHAGGGFGDEEGIRIA